MKHAQRGCGCYVSGVGKTPGIEFCPKHGAAPELLKALKLVMGTPSNFEVYQWLKTNGIIEVAKRAIAKAEEKEN